MSDYASAGSQRWLQIAVNKKPEVLESALRLSGAIGPTASVLWASPLRDDGFREYRDMAAISKAGIAGLRKSLAEFWPARGPVWDAVGFTADKTPVFVEAKAHIPEAASPPTKASPQSFELIEKSLSEARKFYAPKASAIWTNLFYQYANRLAHHYFLTRLNGLKSSLVFLYFVNAEDMQGPVTEEEWHGAIRLIHAVLGLPKDLRSRGVFDAFVDVKRLRDDAGNK
ncbi:hypothetical protein QY049_03160 [Bradyrhizobium sp. WYCCWR 13022]|uniref:hypothetical protein n=1 Tax=unclassified Bradyrhizobium TaxID=2631580 RepID=UPI00263A8FBA|nr:hypothetical protein [Bradyrhizobium sp. WYCCWR 13022]MDN4982224.1 hypothetical protein [Bradyrhizobium sp. WYCCWR 13022]